MAEPALVLNEIAPLAKVTGGRLKMVSDQELLASTRRLVGASNQILAELLAHLAEVESRGAHRVRLCTSLYTYCIYELRFSEDAAFRRVSAARLLQKFPALYEVIASGELHLTGLLQVGPHLTPQNFSEVLARAKHRTKKELTKLVRELDPLPDVPARIEPLGPLLAPPVPVRNPTWAEYMRGLAPVNHLLPGDRPRDWMSDTPFANLAQPKPHCDRLERDEEHGVQVELNAEQALDAKLIAGEHRQSCQPKELRPRAHLEGRGGLEGRSDLGCEGCPEDTELSRCDDESEPSLPVPKLEEASVLDLGQLEGSLTLPQRYAVQFTASQEYVDLVAKAQALLSHTSKPELEELHLRAMKLLVAELERKKFATTKHELPPNKRRKANKNGRPVPAQEGAATGVDTAEGDSAIEDEHDVGGTGVISTLQRDAAEEQELAAVTEGKAAADDTAAAGGKASDPEPITKDAARSNGQGAPRQRGRYIPAAVRRAVLERDGLRCTHLDETGARCTESHRLDFHHVHAHGRGGEHTVDNVTLHCRAHNDLAAQKDFGVEKMRAAREGQRHEALARQTEPP